MTVAGSAPDRLTGPRVSIDFFQQALLQQRSDNLLRRAAFEVLRQWQRQQIRSLRGGGENDKLRVGKLHGGILSF